MGTAADWIADGGIGDQQGNLNPMFEAHNVRFHPGFPVEFFDPMSQIVQICSSALQPLRSAYDSGIVPHRGSDRYPILVDESGIRLTLRINFRRAAN